MAVGDAAWHISTALIMLLGSFGVLFSLKELGDPMFSDMLSPGPGQMFLGDAGRMLSFETGPDGVQSKLMGMPAWMVEGALLTMGSIGVLAAVSTYSFAQMMTAVYLPMEAYYMLWSAAYFPIVGNDTATMPAAVIGIALLALAYWRVLQMIPDGREPASFKAGVKFAEWEALVWTFQKYLFVLAVATAYMIHTTHANAELEADSIERYKIVARHFLQVNGMTWSKGLAYPDGFQPPKEGFWIFAKPAAAWSA